MVVVVGWFFIGIFVDLGVVLCLELGIVLSLDKWLQISLKLIDEGGCWYQSGIV